MGLLEKAEGTSQRKIIFGSRRSKLALWQTNHFAKQMVAVNPGLEFCIQEISTTGDRHIDEPLPEIGGKGLFTAELDQALKQQEIDVAIRPSSTVRISSALRRRLATVVSTPMPRNHFRN